MNQIVQGIKTSLRTLRWKQIKENEFQFVEVQTIYTGQKVSSCDKCSPILDRQASEFLSVCEILLITRMSGDERFFGFISVLGAWVIRDYIPYPSPVHQHINHPISISLMRGWEGSAWWPLLVTLGFRMDRGGGAGTDTGCSWIMDDFSRAVNFGRPVYIATENLPDKWPSKRGKTALPVLVFTGAHGQVWWWLHHV